MRKPALAPARLIAAPVVLSLIIAACGSGTTHHTNALAAATTHSTATTTATAPRPDVDPHLRILAPRNKAHVTQTMTVHVSVSGGKATGSHAFKYVLDGKLTRLGPARVTYAGLTPGTHRLLVSLVAQPSVRAVVAFTVTAPPAPPAPTTTTTAPTPPSPTTTAPAPNPPPPTTATPPPSPPPPTSCIPQHGGGDGDHDNHGAPSDGDGCI